MNAERLNAIAFAVIVDINKTKTDITLQAMVKSLQNQVSQPQAPQFQQQVSQHLTTLATSLKDAPSNTFSPAWKETLKELGLHDLLGINLLIRIQEIFQRNLITPSVALEELQTIYNQLTTRKASLEQIISSFRNLGIGAEELKPGTCEVGVLIPRLAINNKLNEFASDLNELNRIFGTFSELTTRTRPDFDIRSISSSDLNVFLSMAPVVAAGIAVAVERIVGIYKQILEIRKLHGQLKNQGLTTKELQAVWNHANNMMKNEIEKLITELLDKYYDKKDEGRRNELTTELRFSLNKIANRIDKGYSVEIRVQPLSEEEKAAKKGGKASADAEHIQVILEASKGLEFLQLAGEPILTLPESQNNAEDKKDREI
jgi:hypothetical protein